MPDIDQAHWPPPWVLECFEGSPDTVRILPGERDEEIVIHHSHSYLVWTNSYEAKSKEDAFWHGAIRKLYQDHTSLTQQYDSLKQENAELREKFARMQQAMFGTSSEQSPDVQPNTPAPVADPVEPADGQKVVSLTRAREARNTGRKPLPANLPREQVMHDIPEHDRYCPCCHGAIQPIGEEITEQLTVIPAQYKVLQHVRKKYVCRKCSKFVTAPSPQHLIEKSSYASPDFLAHVACSKYQFGLPFYRQESIFEQQGLSFNRTTLANLMISTSDRLSAVLEQLRHELLSQDAIHADETTIQVLKEPGRKAQSKSYLWLYRSREDAGRPVVLFEYQQTRQAAHPRRVLDIDGEMPFVGYLQVDGYAGYNGLNGVIRVGCMAHVRRKFMEIIKTLPKEATRTHAHYAVDVIGKLYDIERKIRGSPHSIRHRVRQDESVPILNEFKAWLDDILSRVTPQSGLGRAVRYAVDQWDAVSRYVCDGRLSIDNNVAERSIKDVVIGRKNWLFADSVEGARTNAAMYSLVLTAKANGIDPFKYLRYLIETMPKLRRAHDVHCLLPWNTPLFQRQADSLAA